MNAGSAVRDFTPKTSQFLYGYPHVPRMSEGVHDPLLSSALYLESGDTAILFIANDIVYIPRAAAMEARSRIGEATGMDTGGILISATHTHSGPKIMDSPLNKNDPVIPPADPSFLAMITDAIVDAGIAAVRNARPATLATALADSTGIGTNRHDPSGPADHDVPLLAVRSAADDQWIGLMYVCSMHPTMLPRLAVRNLCRLRARRARQIPRGACDQPGQRHAAWLYYDTGSRCGRLVRIGSGIVRA